MKRAFGAFGDKTPAYVNKCWYYVSTVTDRFKKGVGIFQAHGGLLRMSEALNAGMSRKLFYAMRDEGVIEQLSRGLYRLSSLPGLETPDLVAVARRIPKGVICLLSALAYHELTTHIPHSVDVAILRGSEKPCVDYPPVSSYWFSSAAFNAGIEVHTIDGECVRIYSAEKSIADVFKYRHKIGMDLVLEALRTWRANKAFDVEGLLAAARTCRVESVVRPYLETIL